MVPHVAHHERTLPALASLHRELDAALDRMIETVKTYYWIVVRQLSRAGRQALRRAAVDVSVRLGGAGADDVTKVQTIAPRSCITAISAPTIPTACVREIFSFNNTRARMTVLAG